jgi:hypothetical protein
LEEQLNIEKNDHDNKIKSLKEGYEQNKAVQIAEGISTLEREVFIYAFI